jgi:hypothetical protein
MLAGLSVRQRAELHALLTDLADQVITARSPRDGPPEQSRRR